MSAKEPSRRKRGGQPGNVNALRGGKRSKRLRKLIVALMADPDVRSIVLALSAAQVEDHRLQLDHARFLYRVSKLKQEMRRYGALVDKRTRAKQRRQPEAQRPRRENRDRNIAAS